MNVSYFCTQLETICIVFLINTATLYFTDHHLKNKGCHRNTHYVLGWVWQRCWWWVYRRHSCLCVCLHVCWSKYGAIFSAPVNYGRCHSAHCIPRQTVVIYDPLLLSVQTAWTYTTLWSRVKHYQYIWSSAQSYEWDWIFILLWDEL